MDAKPHSGRFGQKLIDAASSIATTSGSVTAWARFDVALKELEEQYEALVKAAKAVSEEWHWPNEEPPSETYFHDLIVELDELAGLGDEASSPAKRPT